MSTTFTKTIAVTNSKLYFYQDTHFTVYQRKETFEHILKAVKEGHLC